MTIISLFSLSLYLIITVNSGYNDCNDIVLLLNYGCIKFALSYKPKLQVAAVSIRDRACYTFKAKGCLYVFCVDVNEA